MTIKCVVRWGRGGNYHVILIFQSLQSCKLQRVNRSVGLESGKVPILDLFAWQSCCTHTQNTTSCFALPYQLFNALPQMTRRNLTRLESDRDVVLLAIAASLNTLMIVKTYPKLDFIEREFVKMWILNLFVLKCVFHFLDAEANTS